jgi:glycosyltransferase involved in cell wall biosynthesis
MKIAVIAPPWIPIPPSNYGGIESVIYDLVEGLTEMGEEVILFAQQGSKVSCRLYPYLDKPRDFGLNSPGKEKRFVAELSSKYAYAMAGYEKADIIHDHTLAIPGVNVPIVSLHGPANEATVKRCEEISKNPHNFFVTISNRQKENYEVYKRKINFLSTVYNSIDVKKVGWRDKKEDFCFFAGRANWEKGVDLAVRVASRARAGLIMAIKMAEDFEKEFFRKEVKPWIDSYPKNLLFGIHHDLNKESIFEFYQRARYTLFTSQWEEPFGLVMIESMACGTPVIGLRRGSVPEVIVDGKTGFLADSEEDMAEATKKIGTINPMDCRLHVEKNFSRERMCRNYLEAYIKIQDMWRMSRKNIVPLYPRLKVHRRVSRQKKVSGR